MECSDGSGISSRVYNGREDGVMGSLAARRVAEGDWAGVWEAVIVDLFPGVAIRWDSSSSSASLAVGADAFGTRGDIERHCGPSIGPLDGWVAGPLTLDGEPGNQPDGGYDGYRAALAGDTAWTRTRRPKRCKLATNACVASTG